MDKTKVLICGATALTGRNIAERLMLDPRFEVYGTHFRHAPYPGNIMWHQVDLRRPEDVKRIVKDMDIVIHAAAVTFGSKMTMDNPFGQITDNAIMSSYILRAICEQKVGHFIFFSSATTYQPSEVPLKESDFDGNIPLYPRYAGIGNTKIYLEKICEFTTVISDTKVTVIRPSNIYGPYDKFVLDYSHVLPATITKVMRAQNHITVWGDGSEKRDFVYVDDLVDFVVLAIENQKEKYELLNCGCGNAISVKDLVYKIMDIAGKNHLSVFYDLSQPTIKKNVSLDCSLAKEKIGWTLKVDLDEGIKRTMEWYEENIKVPEHLEERADI